MSEETQLKAELLCLVQGAKETVSMEGLENGSDVTIVFIKVLRPGNDVIKINVTNLSNVITQCMKHAALVGAGHVAA